MTFLVDLTFGLAIGGLLVAAIARRDHVAQCPICGEDGHVMPPARNVSRYKNRR